MPVRITKTKKGYRVSTPNMVHSRHTTKSNAMKQARLLRAIEHGWRPSKSKQMKKISQQYDTDYMNKICGVCGRSSPKGLTLDLQEIPSKRRWKCNKCYTKQNE